MSATALLLEPGAIRIEGLEFGAVDNWCGTERDRSP